MHFIQKTVRTCQVTCDNINIYLFIGIVRTWACLSGSFCHRENKCSLLIFFFCHLFLQYIYTISIQHYVHVLQHEHVYYHHYYYYFHYYIIDTARLWPFDSLCTVFFCVFFSMVHCRWAQHSLVVVVVAGCLLDAYISALNFNEDNNR